MFFATYTLLLTFFNLLLLYNSTILGCVPLSLFLRGSGFLVSKKVCKFTPDFFYYETDFYFIYYSVSLHFCG
jgi:hypothetical protein